MAVRIDTQGKIPAADWGRSAGVQGRSDDSFVFMRRGRRRWDECATMRLDIFGDD
jgi:hypothetical protein